MIDGMLHLKGEGHDVAVTAQEWSQLRQIALQGGWVPKGTVKLNSSGSETVPILTGQDYEPGEGQMVIPEDAQNLGMALEKGWAAGLDLPPTYQQLQSVCQAGGFFINPG
jgi:hypothetical protein